MIKNYFAGFIGDLFEKRYLEWDEYKARIAEIECLTFMTKTCQKAAENYWLKEVRR